ncbi:hypothetical protein [uncultured phage]|nr:hypothetical protein [uncultured phage]
MPRRKKVSPDNSTPTPKSPVSGRVSRFDNLIPNSPIEFGHYPIWERQPYEMAQWFEKFQAFYIHLPAGYRTLNRAFNDCATSAGEEIPKTESKRNITVPEQWQLAYKMYRWEDRAKAYWLKKIQDQEAYRNEILNQIIDKSIKNAFKTLEKSEEINNRSLDDPNGNWSHKDAIIMTKAVTEIVEKALGLDTVEYAISILQKNGLAAIDPDGNLIGQPTDKGNSEDETIL